jgi:PhoH-like ATPase
MQKIFVLDTNVILHEPRAIFSFGEHAVVLPIYVVEELDQFKKGINGLGRNARAIARELDALRKTEGRLSDGVPLPNGGSLRVTFLSREQREDPSFAVQHQYDNLILRSALTLREDHPNKQVILVTKDTNLRIRADAVGIDATDYDPAPMDPTNLYKGHQEIQVESDGIRAAYRDGYPVDGEEFSPNEYVTMRDVGSDTHIALARYDAEANVLRTLQRRQDDTTWGITPRNREQAFALDLLLDDSIPLVTMVGKAGTGKTLLALAAGLEKVTDEQVYQKVLVSRPIFPLGRDIGFLPGTVEEKLDPWMKPIYDNVELLLGLNSSGGRRGNQAPQALVDMGVLEIEPLTYIRGRSIPKQYLIVDEAQNLTPHEVKTILTRAGEGTKVILTGDPYQIDNPYVDVTNNGLVHLVNRFRGESCSGTVTLMQGERSPLAETAANLL